MLYEIVNHVLAGKILDAEDIENIMKEVSWCDLLWCANKLREAYKGNKVFACSIINAKSGLCSEDCSFCAQSKFHNTNVPVYPLLSKDELIKKALELAELGATYFSFVTSGKRLSKKDIDTVCEAAYEIKKRSGIRLCASLGIINLDNAISLRQAGISKYHHNLETSRSFFPNICTTHDYDEDIETIKVAKKANLFVCSGGIIGLGEDFSHRIELAQLLRELDVDSIPINFLNPIKGTKLENMPILPAKEALTCIAIFRLINPNKDITICGGREVCLKDLQSWVFFAGANGIMIGNYLTTKGRNIEDDLMMIKDLGFELEYE